MSWPTDDLSNANTNQGTDDPSAARSDLDLLITRVKDIIAGRATSSGICDLDGSTKVPVARMPNITVAKGGTGIATAAAQSILAGNGTSPLQVITPGTAGQLLTTQGSGSPPNWTSQGFATGVKAWFYQAAAPTGWSIDASTTGAVLGVNVDGDTNGTLGGAWGGDVGATAITEDQMPAHTHDVNRSTIDTGGITTRLRTVATSNAASPLANAALTTGGGGTHLHSTAGWRPKAHNGIICVKS